jgi:hypothetical protein
MSKHRVRKHHWNGDRLESIDHWFETVEEAMGFADQQQAYSFHIYTESGELVHHRFDETYA